MKKRIISRLLVCMMIFSLLPTAVFAADLGNPEEWDTLVITKADGTEAVKDTDYSVATNSYNYISDKIPYHVYTLFSSDLVISRGAVYTDPSASSAPQKSKVNIASSVENANITLNGVTALASIEVAAGKSATFTLVGENHVDGIIGGDATGNSDATLTFSGEGTLVANHIGGDSKYGENILCPKLVINGGNYVINGGYDSFSCPSGYVAGIGGGQYCNVDGITINGGTISVQSNYGAAIGGGQNGYAKNITIKGGTINAKGSFGAAIGGGQNGIGEDITINGGTLVLKTSRGGIGGGQKADGKNISITGGDITIIDGAGGGALIGGGQDANAEGISITGGKLRLETKHQSGNKEYWNVGIGAGSNSANANTTASNVTISNADIAIKINPTTASMQNKGYGYAVGTPNASTDATNVSMNCGVYNGNKLPDAYHADGYSSYLLSNYTYVIGKTDTVKVTDGKVVKGTFAFDVTEYASDTSTVTENDGVWTVTPPTVNIGGETETTAEVTVEQAYEVDMTSNSVAQEIKELDDTTKEAITTNTSVSGVNLTTEAAAEAPAGTKSGLQAVVDAAVEQNTELATAIATAETVNIEVKVDVIPKEFKKSANASESAPEVIGTVTFELKPTATVTVGSGEAEKSATVPVENSMIDQTKPITVSIYTGFEPVKIVHTGDDNFEEVFRKTGDKTFTYKEGVCTLTISHFSELTAVAKEYVAQIEEQKYETLAKAVSEAKDGDTIELLDDVMLKNVVNMNNGIILDCKGHTVSASKEADSYYMGESSKTNPSSSAVALLNIGNGQKVTIKNGIFETQAYARCNIGTGTGSELTLDNVKLIHVEYSSRGNDALQLNGALIVKNDLTIEMGSNIRYWKDKNGGEVPEGFINRAWGGISFNNDDCSIDFTNCTGFAVTDMEGEAYGLTQAPIHIYHTGTFDKDTIENTFMNVKAPANIKGMVKVIGNAWDMTGFAFANSAFLKNNYPVKIGDVYFQSIAKAVEYVENGETITLLEDVTLTDRLVISNGKTFTLDLGSKTLTGRVNVSGAKLTVKNGTINAGSMSQALNAYGTTDSNYNTTNNLFTYIKVENDVTLTGNYGMCFLSLTENSYSAIAYGVKVDFYGTANAPCGAFISGNIGATSDNRQGTLMHGENAPVFNVYGKLNATSGGAEDSTQGISLNGYTIVNVYEGAEISGAEAVGVKAGQLNVYGGTLTATGPKCDPVAAINSGTDASGGAIAVSSTYSAGTGKIIVNVKGGTIKSQNNAALLVTHSYKKNIAALFANGVEVMVEGGKFVGNGNAVFVADKLEGDSEYYPAKFISGGYYTADPSAYLANGYAVAGSDIQGYAYTVAEVERPDGGNSDIAVASGEPEVEIGSGIAEGNKTAVENAAEETEVAGLGTDALKEAAKVNAGSAKAELEAALGTTVSNTVTVFAQTYLDVKPEAYSTEGDKVYTVDITPMVQLIATTAENAAGINTTGQSGSKNAVALGGPTELKVTTPVVVTIPLPTGFAEENTVLFVKHTKDNGTAYLYKCTVQKTGEQLYIQFVNNNGFSTFEITTKDTSVASIVKGGSTLYYTSLRAAVEAVANGETITLTANCGETVTVARAVSFTLDKNGKTFSGSITPGANYKNTGSANEATISYVFTYVAPSGGGGGVAYYAVSAASATHGKVTVDKASASAGSTVTITVAPEKGFTLETLTVKDAKGNEVALTAVKTGETYTFKMPAGKVTISATFMEDNTMLNFFVDVKADDYYYDAVLWAAQNGITSGVDATHFAPMAITTRGQMVTFLWRAAGCPEPTSTTCAFADVKTSEYYYKAVLWAAETGLTKGTSDTTFSPDAEVSRGQTVAFLARLNGVKDDATGYSHNFADVSAADYFNNAVAWAYENKITDGTSATTFSPNDDCLRGQIVTFLYRNFVK